MQKYEAYVATETKPWFPSPLHLIISAPHHADRCSAQFLDPLHNQSNKNMTLCVMGLPLDLIHGTALRLLVGIKGRVWECGILTVVLNSETTFYLRINLSSTIVCSSNTEIFHIWILNIMLDLIAFLSLNTVSVYRLNKGNLQRGR